MSASRIRPGGRRRYASRADRQEIAGDAPRAAQIAEDGRALPASLQWRLLRQSARLVSRATGHRRHFSPTLKGGESHPALITRPIGGICRRRSRGRTGLGNRQVVRARLRGSRRGESAKPSFIGSSTTSRLGAKALPENIPFEPNAAHAGVDRGAIQGVSPASPVGLPQWRCLPRVHHYFVVHALDIDLACRADARGSAGRAIRRSRARAGRQLRPHTSEHYDLHFTT